jgi:leucyl-tRNA synthetase
MRLFDSWYNKESDKAEPIGTLIARFVASGSTGISAVSDEDFLEFSATNGNLLMKKNNGIVEISDCLFA